MFRAVSLRAYYLGAVVSYHEEFINLLVVDVVGKAYQVYTIKSMAMPQAGGLDHFTVYLRQDQIGAAAKDLRILIRGLKYLRSGLDIRWGSSWPTEDNR